MSILASSPIRDVTDGQRARVVSDAVISAYINEVAQAGVVARRRVERVAETRDAAGVVARSARCMGSRRSSVGRPEVRGAGDRVSEGTFGRRNFGRPSRNQSATARQSA
jgi:hypothetical protein